MRRASALLALPTAVLMLVLSASTQGAPAHLARSLDKQQAIAFARAVNLKGGDVPEFGVSTVHDRETTADRHLEHAVRTCVGPASAGPSPSGTPLTEVSSNGFGREAATYEQSVSSEVSVTPTPTLIAAKAPTEIRNSHVRRCLTRYVNLLLKVQKDPSVKKLGPIEIAPLTLPDPAAKASFGARITARIKVGVFDIHVYLDVLSYVRGSAEVTLLTSGAPQPFPAATEEHLFSLLVTRANEKRL